jgi:4-hydroxythreonine-4-phosphate dehydrogenase
MTVSLAVTPGEPAGIGPDLLIQFIQRGYDHELVAITDPEVLEHRARSLGLRLHLRDPCNAPLAPGELAIKPVVFPAKVSAGELNANNADTVLTTVEFAVEGCLSGEFAALITGPIHKGIINQAGIPFTGHTEYLADLCQVSRVVMLLETRVLRVALATTHVPLSSVPGLLTAHLLTEVLTIVARDFQTKLAIAKPKILVCGLNPHAGESGYLGNEDISIILPVIEQFKRQGFDVDGPLPADTIFTPKYIEQADVVLAMYHDQGLPVLKYIGFGEAVNITLGLPFIRTSVDHGTALELAGSGQASSGSLAAAIDRAQEIACNVSSER